MPPIDPRLIIVFVWIVGVSLVAFVILWRGRHPATQRRLPLPSLPLLLLLTFLLRLAPALILPRGARYEMSVFRQAGDLTLAGQSVYLNRVAHPYLPFQLYWYAAAVWLTNNAGIFFEFWVKLLNIAAEVGLTALIFQAVRHNRGESAARYAALFYAFNPVTIMVSSYQGQFDAVPLLFLLLAWYILTYQPARRGALLTAALALGVAILSKTWPVLLAPILFLRLPRWGRRIRFTLFVALIPLAGIWLYEARFPGSLMPMLRRAARAGSIPGWWGYSAVLNVLATFTGRGGLLYAFLNQVGKWVALALASLTIWWTRSRQPLYAFMLAVLILFACVPNLGVQGLSWIVPLAVILGCWNELGWYAVGTTLYMWIAYWGIHLSDGLMLLLPKPTAHATIQLASLLVWVPIVLWLWQEVAGRGKMPALFRPHLRPQAQEDAP